MKKKNRFFVSVDIPLEDAMTMPFKDLQYKLDEYWQIRKAQAIHEIARLRSDPDED